MINKYDYLKRQELVFYFVIKMTFAKIAVYKYKKYNKGS